MSEQQDAQEAIMQLQESQQKLQQIQVQKEETKADVKGIEKALRELENENEGDVYKSVGNLLINKDRDKLEEELNEKKEDLDVRLESLEKRENTVQKKMQEAQQKFTQQMGQQ